MLRKIDHWIGKTLFVPVIIRICQQFGWSQYRLHWNVLVVAGLLFIADSERLRAGWLGWTLFVLVGLTTIVVICIATLDPEYQPRSTDETRFRFRMWDLLGVPVVLLGIVAKGVVDISDPWPILLLAAEYALTIKTIPPKEAKERKRSLATQNGG